MYDQKQGLSFFILIGGLWGFPETIVYFEFFHEKTDHEIWEYHDEEREDVIEGAWDGLNFLFECGVDGFFGEDVGWHERAEFETEGANFVGDGEEGGIDAAWADGGDADVPRFEFEIQ